MPYSQDMLDLMSEVADARIKDFMSKATSLTGATAGTVAYRVNNTECMVTLDGSDLAVPVKVFGDVEVLEGDRVGLVRIGTDWTIVGTFTRRRKWTMPDGAPAGTGRMVWGADTPPELASYGIDQAMLAYVTDVSTGLEVGYFFVGASNRMDAGAVFRALVFGNVTYPTAGNPASATAADVKTNFQQDMYAQANFTIFKDHHLLINPGLDVIISQGKIKGHTTNATDEALGLAKSTGDTVERFELYTDGQMQWGPGGSAARDTKLFRSAANTLNLEDGSGGPGTLIFSGANKLGVLVAGPNVSSTTNAFADITSASFTFTKRYSSTRLRVCIASTWYTDNVNGSIALSVNVNGTDHLVTQMLGSNHTNRNHLSGFDYLTGVSAGTFTVKGRLKNPSATGTTHIDANDYTSVECEECP